MNPTTFSGNAAISAGWNTFKRNPVFFVCAWVLLFAATGVVDFLRMNVKENIAASFLGLVVSIAVSILVNVAQTNVALRASESPESVGYRDLWAPQYLLPFALLLVLLGVLTVLGLLCLIIPGIIISLLFLFSSFRVIDVKASVFDAMRQSARMTKGNLGGLFLFMLALIGINILGLLALVVGLLVSIPVSALALAHAYQMLKAKADVVAPPIMEPLTTG